jgi:hypothetical protein
MPTILETIAIDLAAITEREMSRVAANLEDPEEGDEVLLLIPADIHRLYALQHEYIRKSKLALHAALFDLDDPADRERMRSQGSRLSTLSTIVSEIAWAEARELAGEKAWSVPSLALRKGFILVSNKDEDKEAEKELQGVMVPLPPGTAKIFKQAVERMMQAKAAGEAEPDANPPDPKKKVQ